MQRSDRQFKLDKLRGIHGDRQGVGGVDYVCSAGIAEQVWGEECVGWEWILLSLVSRTHTHLHALAITSRMGGVMRSLPPRSSAPESQPDVRTTLGPGAGRIRLRSSVALGSDADGSCGPPLFLAPVCPLSLNMTDHTPLYYLLVDCSSAATMAASIALPTLLALMVLALVTDRTMM